MLTLSNALPVQFWPYGDYTFNELPLQFADNAPFYQEWQIDDIIKLQGTDTDASKEYALLITDINQNLLQVIAFTHTGTYRQLSFSAATIDNPFADTCVYLYIAEQGGTFDITFDYTFQDFTNIIYQSDLQRFSTAVVQSPSWGSKLIQYSSTKNFASIQYPNDSSPFFFRVPCRFLRQRFKTQQNSIQLSDSTTINTSTEITLQKLLTTIYVPDYLNYKLQLILQHAVRGSVSIDGDEFIMDENYELTNPDPKTPMQMGQVWLTYKNKTTRNII